MAASRRGETIFSSDDDNMNGIEKKNKNLDEFAEKMNVCCIPDWERDASVFSERFDEIGK